MSFYYLYGAGKYVENFVQMVLYFGDDVAGIIDGDIRKQGGVIDGVYVYPPEQLLSSKYRVIISCMATEEIRDNLKEMNVANREVRIQAYLYEISRKVCVRSNNINKQNIICFDLCSGAEWGGAENWNYYLADKYKMINPDVNVMIISDEYKDNGSYARIPMIEVSKNDNIKKMIGTFPENECIYFLNSFFGVFFFAMLALKVEHPDRVRLITIVHNDYKDLYRICDMFKDYIDCFICVSTKIQKSLNKICGVQSGKVFFLHQPMEIKDRTRSESHCSEIKLGVATRLTKQQKRADYLPMIIDQLEKKGIEYKMYIAGDGDYYEILDEFIKNRCLTERVFLLGRINHDEMWDYWNKIDIYLNFSDFEGSSLSMLEAMSCGCVPIVTDVSGTRDYIENEVNGFIVNIGGIDKICEKVEYLSHNQDIIRVMGVKSRNSILERCNADSYVSQFNDILKEL